VRGLGLVCSAANREHRKREQQDERHPSRNCGGPVHGTVPAQADKPDIIILPGDMSYADDYNGFDPLGYQPRWDIWGRLTQFLFANTILVPTIGL